MKHPLVYGIAALAAVFTAACATSPTGRSQLQLLPEDQMAQMGAQAFQDLKTKTPIDSNPATNAYVRCVANEITAQVDDGQKWEIVVFKDPEPNAFALPGGKIGVHTGMLNVAAEPSQLAAVLGHEVGHVMAHHGNERASEQLALQGGLEVVSAIFKDKTSQKYQLVMSALGVGAQYGLLLPHSRTQESEADTIGLKLMSQAGFDPRGAVQLWRNMEASSGGQPPEFMSTHPSHGTRIQVLEAAMPQAVSLYQSAGKRPTCKR